MKRYTVGFLFYGDDVALIRKARPEWQKGKVNGVGGHIEKNEMPVQCMAREFREETGTSIPESNWQQVALITHNNFEMSVFHAEYPTDQPRPVFTYSESEPVYWYHCDHLPDNIIPNLKWMIALRYDKDLARYIEVQYKMTEDEALLYDCQCFYDEPWDWGEEFVNDWNDKHWGVLSKLTQDELQTLYRLVEKRITFERRNLWRNTPWEKTMGISRITAYTIATNEVDVAGVGPVEGKYQGLITHSNRHEHHPGMVIISTEYEYDSAEDAKKAMSEAVREIRKAVLGDSPKESENHDE